MILGLAMIVAAGFGTCHSVTADRIYGRDLAQAIPAFQNLPASLVVGLSPFPGQQRVFRPGELRRIAEANGIDAPVAEGICFSWPMSTPPVERFRTAMEKTLAGRNAQIEIVERSLAAVPPGEMIFALEGLSGTSDAPVLWRGTIAYAEKRIFNVWARVRITVQEPRVVAAQTLKPGDEIRAEQVKLETYSGPLPHETPFNSIAAVVGMTARNSLTAGLPLTRTLLRERNEVERGDLVRVRVELNQTHLEAQGVAEDSGRNGSVITVRNGRSGRKFRALVEGKGKVLVMPEGPTGLVTEESRHETSN